MLIFERMEGEVIMIGDDIEIKVFNIRPGLNKGIHKVSIGVKAPKSLHIHRREIYDVIQREKAQTSQSNSP